MRKIQSDWKDFKSFCYARFATDVTFQQFYCLSETMSERKAYFSGKHKHSDYNVELSALSTRLCIECTKHHHGLVSDLQPFLQNHHFHEEASKKVTGDLQRPGQELLGQISRKYWTILADRGYQGASKTIRVIHLKKEYRNIALTPLEEAKNCPS